LLLPMVDFVIDVIEVMTGTTVPRPW
jgi:hypothetical protein